MQLVSSLSVGMGGGGVWHLLSFLLYSSGHHNSWSAFFSCHQPCSHHAPTNTPESSPVLTVHYHHNRDPITACFPHCSNQGTGKAGTLPLPLPFTESGIFPRFKGGFSCSRLCSGTSFLQLHGLGNVVGRGTPLIANRRGWDPLELLAGAHHKRHDQAPPPCTCHL